MRNPFRAGAVLRVLGTAILFVAPAAGAPALVDSLPLADYLRELSASPDSAHCTQLFYALDGGIRSGRLAVRTSAEARAVTLLMARLMEGPAPGVVRWRAASFLESYPHPAAADALWRTAILPGRTNVLARSSALSALVALHDSRALPQLLADLARPEKFGHEATLRLLGDLGDPHAISAIQAIVDDPKLEERFAPGDWAAAERRHARSALRRIESASHELFTPWDLDDAALTLLRRNGFVILPEPANDMFEFYGAEYPFVTSDVAFHSFMILAREALNELEMLVLVPRLRNFSRDCMSDCIAQIRALRDRRLRDLALRNAATFAVASVLLDAVQLQDLGLPFELTRAVEREVSAIRGHKGIASSNLFDCKVDYTQYRPRGRHSRGRLQGYFQAMMLYGQMGYHLRSVRETRSALLLVDVLQRNPRLRAEWEAIDGLVGQFFGPHDDLSVRDYEAALAIAQTAGARDARSIARDPVQVGRLTSVLRRLPAPRVNSEGTVDTDSTAGLRVFGRRYSRTMHLFQQYMDGGLWPVSGVHVAADLLGSARARELLHASGREASTFGVLPPDPLPDPNASLPEGFLHCTRTLFEREDGAPSFMHAPPWEEKQINTALGGWAEVQNTVLLYGKDARMTAGASAMIDRFHGWVEPVPRFYSRLDSLLQRFVAALDGQDLFAKIAADSTTLHSAQAAPPTFLQANRYRDESIRLERPLFEDLSHILARLETIARQELRVEPQSIDDGVFLKSLQRRFKAIALNRSNSDHAFESMALVADVATEYQSGQCLEVGVGRPCAIYVAVPDSGRTFVCRGGVYTYYEFVRDITSRLDDTEWKRMSQSVLGGELQPWLAGRLESGLQRYITRAQLKALRLETGNTARGTHGGDPTMISDYENAALLLAGTHVAPADVDVLLTLASQDLLNLGVRAYVFDRLAEHGDDARVLPFLRTTLQSLPRPTDRWDHVAVVTFVGAVRGLGGCGSPALGDLDTAERRLEGRGLEYMNPKLRQEIAAARATIARANTVAAVRDTVP